MSASRLLPSLLLAAIINLPLEAGAALVSHWQFGGNFSDSVGSNNGVAAGPAGSFQTGYVGQGWQPGGQGSVVQVADATSLDLSNFTISAWIRLDAYNYYNMAFFWKGDASGADLTSPYSLAIRGAYDGSNGGKLISTVGDGSSSQFAMGNTVLDLGRFHHVAVTVDGSWIRLYVDGLLDGQVAQTVTPYANNTDLQIGSMLNVPILNALNGVVDELKLYDQALSSADIAAEAGRTLPEPGAVCLMGAALAACRRKQRA